MSRAPRALKSGSEPSLRQAHVGVPFHPRVVPRLMANLRGLLDSRGATRWMGQCDRWPATSEVGAGTLLAAPTAWSRTLLC